MKTLFTLTLCLLLAASPVLAASDGDTYYVAVSELNIRESASKSADVITMVGRGTALTATGNTSGQWVEVYTDCYTIRYSEARGEEKIGPLCGWVMIQYLSEEPPYTGLEGTITGCKEVKFRSDPVVSEKTVLKKLAAGETVSLLSVFEYGGNRWYRARVGDKRGFVMCEYVGVGNE